MIDTECGAFEVATIGEKDAEFCAGFIGDVGGGEDGSSVADEEAAALV